MYVSNLLNFLQELKREQKAIKHPSRDEVVRYAISAFVMLALFMVFFTFTDFLSFKIISLVLSDGI